MSDPAIGGVPDGGSAALLEIIRRHEAEVKRRLAAGRQEAQSALADAERRARDVIAAAEAEGRREGERQRRAAQAEADHEAEIVVSRAGAQAGLLGRVGSACMEEAIAQAVALIMGARP